MNKITREQAIKLIESAETIECQIDREMIDVTEPNDTVNKYKSGTLMFTIHGRSRSQYQKENAIELEYKGLDDSAFNDLVKFYRSRNGALGECHTFDQTLIDIITDRLEQGDKKLIESIRHIVKDK